MHPIRKQLFFFKIAGIKYKRENIEKVLSSTTKSD